MLNTCNINVKGYKKKLLLLCLLIYHDFFAKCSMGGVIRSLLAIDSISGEKVKVRET